MTRSLPLALLVFTISLASAPVAASVRRSLPRAPLQNPQEQTGGLKKKNPPPGARGFEQFAGRDAADKLIKGAATRRHTPEFMKKKTPQAGESETYARDAEKQRAAGNYEAAVVAYKKAIELRKNSLADDGNLQYALGKVYSDMERYEDAAGEFLYASTRRPSNEIVLYATYELGNAYLDLGMYAEAIGAYNKTLEILAGDWKKFSPRLSEEYLPYPYYSMGLAHVGLGQKEQAVAAFEKAVALKPDFAEAHFNLGLTLWQLGKADEARATETKLRILNAELADKLSALFK
ncbi:MAG TPA: tetratricopeptide repeat protein [Pyrinomonadaceae bacterium]|nr:tetratricopeptide repeat protein [Pyrinomonadaceae bacterium]